MTHAKKIVLILVGLLVVALGAWYALKHPRGGDAVVRLSGNIEVIEVGVSFKIAGRVEKRLVDEGQTVHCGQLIAVLDTSDLEAEVAQRRARCRRRKRSWRNWKPARGRKRSKRPGPRRTRLPRCWPS